jgi:hypothetical protein
MEFPQETIIKEVIVKKPAAGTKSGYYPNLFR